MKEAPETNDLSKAQYNRRVAKAARNAAKWALDAEDSDHYGIEEAAGEAMNDEWGEDYRVHRGRILDYVSYLPDDLDTIHEVYGPENTAELLDCIAREALREEIDRLAWKFQSFGEDIRRAENELSEEQVGAAVEQ